MPHLNMSAWVSRVSSAGLAAGVLFTCTSAFAQPIGYAPSPNDPSSVFRQLFSYRGSVGEARETGEVPTHLRRRIVPYDSREAPGTVIVDTPNTKLYYVLGGGKAIVYGIGVGREGFTWSGVQSIARKAEWPDWIPPVEMLQRQPFLPRFMAGGLGNPLGARALYLGSTAYRIHGTNAPETIGSHASSGCIRMLNEDVIDLYGRVTIGTKVIVLPDRVRVVTSVVEHRQPIADAGPRTVRAFGLY